MNNSRDKILISVVIPAYDEEKNISKCIESLLCQDFQDRYQIIVVDNNSTDNTLLIAKTYPVKVITENQKGVAYARQAGFNLAEGEIIASTDADTIVPKDWLSKIHSLLRDDAYIGVTGPFLFYDRGKIWNRLARIISPIMILLDKMLNRGKSNFNGMNFAIKKNIFKKVGGFNKELQFGEDINLAKKAHAYGSIFFTKEITVFTHSRRYKPTFGFAKYFINFVKTSKTGKPFRNELPSIRKK